MARSFVLVSLSSALIAIAPGDACSKLKGGPPPDPTPTPIPVTSGAPTSTTPPIWAPPDTGGPGPTPTPPPTASANPDLVKARAASAAGEHKKVRTLLEKKVKAGKATPEEASLLLQSCTVLKDKPCIELTKGRYPEIVPGSETPPPVPTQ